MGILGDGIQRGGLGGGARGGFDQSGSESAVTAPGTDYGRSLDFGRSSTGNESDYGLLTTYIS